MNQQIPPYIGGPIGTVVGGSLSQGTEIKLNPSTSVEEIKSGHFITISGTSRRFFGVVTDITLQQSDPAITYQISTDMREDILEALKGTIAYGKVSVSTNLTLPLIEGSGVGIEPAKSIPDHFSSVYMASERDIQLVFGEEDEDHFWVGSPLDMQTKVCLDLDEFVKRSVGVFGKSGTGKTFLTRLLLVGVLQHDKASALIFDMHSEYGQTGQDTDRNMTVKGLKQLFPEKVSVFTLDEESSRRRNSNFDVEAKIGYSEIEPEDLELLRESLNLSDVAVNAAYFLEQKYGARKWFESFIGLNGTEEVYELAQELGVAPQALRALYERLNRFKRFGFLVSDPSQNVAMQMIEHVEKGNHVVLEFGRYGDDLSAYILVSNLLSRRIHRRYVELKEQAVGNTSGEPRPVMIVLEEAHKFLNPGIANQTIFGTIARELRKYNVTIMVIDQRPSAIDNEVMSQLGTRMTCLLDNEKDVESVLSGVSGSRQLRTVLSRMEPKQQALVFGHAVPMPIVLKTRTYGTEEFYRSVGRSEYSPEDLQKEIDELF
tara:strand:+ start:673 stop:2304 length:1632 start_codon:yes stop_codon:yes gene_type:complete